MVNYTLLYKDEETQISYFYNMDDGLVYSDMKKQNNLVYKRMGYLGSIFALFLYPKIRATPAWYIELSGVLSMVIVITGIFIGWIFTLLLIKNSNSFFVSENRILCTDIELQALYVAGKKFRRKYKLLLVFLLIFACINTFVLSCFEMSFFVVICGMGLWVIVSMLFFGGRPVCTKRFEKHVIAQIR